MEIEYSSHFRNAYQKLTVKVQKNAEQKEKLFRDNPYDSRLKTHKLHGKFKGFHSFTIDRKKRIVFKFVSPHKVIFLDVGDHDIYQ